MCGYCRGYCSSCPCLTCPRTPAPLAPLTFSWCCSHGGNATFAALFAENYVNFVMHISQKYADEQARAITYFLAYGPMQTDNDYVAAIDYVYTNLTLQSYKVAVVNLTMANYAPVGCQWHPSAFVHNQMALQAQGQMWRVMNWSTQLEAYVRKV